MASLPNLPPVAVDAANMFNEQVDKMAERGRAPGAALDGQVAEALAGLSKPVLHTGDEQVAVRNNQDMSRGNTDKGIA